MDDVAVNFDTVSGRLAVAGALLQRRNGIWSIELPRERGVRRRIELLALDEWMPPAIADLVLGLAGGEPVVPARATRRRPARSSSRSHLVERSLAASVHRLVRNDGLVRLGDDAEAVHQARVAVRTLRADLRTFAPLLAPEAAVLRRDLLPLADVLGATRDCDVLYARLLRHVDDALIERRDVRFLIDEISHRRAAAASNVIAFLRSRAYVASLDGCAQAPSLVRDRAPRARIVVLAQAPWRRLARAVHRLGSDPPDDALHDTRLMVKRARYAVDAVAPAGGKTMRTFAKALARVQEALGEHQDAVMMHMWLQEAVQRRRDRASVFAVGRLAGFEQRAALDASMAWRSTWKRAEHAAPRAWS